MTHPGKDALERARGWISGPHERGAKYFLSYEANVDDLRDIIAYVEELERLTEIAAGSHARIRSNALEDAARLSATLPYHTGLGVAAAIRALKQEDTSNG